MKFLKLRRSFSYTDNNELKVLIQLRPANQGYFAFWPSAFAECFLSLPPAVGEFNWTKIRTHLRKYKNAVYRTASNQTDGGSWQDPSVVYRQTSSTANLYFSTSCEVTTQMSLYCVMILVIYVGLSTFVVLMFFRAMCCIEAACFPGRHDTEREKDSS